MKRIPTLNNTLTYTPEALLGDSSVVIKEDLSNEKSVLEEFNRLIVENVQIDETKPFKVKALLQRAGVKNQNGRIYLKPTLEREAAKYYENFVKNRSSMGELDHPESSVVSLQNVSHVITEMMWDGDDLYGIIEILPTTKGKDLMTLLKNNISIGVSSRGLGTTKKDVNENADIVQDDFELIAFDIVANNSVIGAKLEQIQERKKHLNESVIIENKTSIPPVKLSKEQYFETIYSRTYDYLIKCMSGMSREELMKQM